MPLTATNLPAWVKEVGGATVLSEAEFEVFEYEKAQHKLVRFVRRQGLGEPGTFDRTGSQEE